MGRKLVTSYAALGVGLAIVLTFGLTAISNVTEQHLDQFAATQRESAKMVPLLPPAPAPEEKLAMEAAAPAPPSAPPSETQENVSAKAGAPSGTGSTTSGEVVIEKAPASRKEIAGESYSIVAEVPASTNPFAGFFVILPYIAAAVAGSVVFVVTRKRVKW